MGEAIFFVVVITSTGAWLAKMKWTDYGNWKEHRTKAILADVRGLIIQPQPGGKHVSISIGDPYILASPNREVVADPIAIELIGEIEKVNDILVCTNNSKLFSDYEHALTVGRAAQSNLTVAKAGDLPNNGKPLSQR